MTQNALDARDPFVQIVSASTSTLQSLTTQTPADDTIPQKTEGTEVLTVTITPKFSTSKLEIVFVSSAANNTTTASSITTALFQDTTSDALAATCTNVGGNVAIDCYLHHVMTSGTTSSTTFKIRIGPDVATTIYINGQPAGTQVYGGVSDTILTVKEYL